MCGGYSEYSHFFSLFSTADRELVNRDDFISRFKVLKYGREEILKQVSAT
jgi:hypothetical protein